MENLLVIVTSDHGEAFYEHKAWFHRNSLYDEVLRVPLVIRGPGIAPGRCDVTVSLEGVAETVVRAAGFTPPEIMTGAGHALLPPPERDRVCYGRLAYKNRFCLSKIVGAEKWIISQWTDPAKETHTCIERFDLDADPGEQNNLVSEHPDRVGALLALLDRQVHNGRCTPGEPVPNDRNVTFLYK